MTLEEFIEKCKKRPLPSNPIARVKLLARELAEGLHYDLWGQYLDLRIGARGENNKETLLVLNASQRQYLENRWENHYPHLRLLETHGYMGEKLQLTEKAIALLEETEPATLFISYKRSESSAFALLVEDRLSQAGLSPFLDKQLQAGDDWHAELEQKIASADYFLLILGKKTLESQVTIKEIAWALEYQKTLIPIWHNGFAFKAEEWPLLPVEISQALANTHTIRVIEENPLTYDTALRELLNRFGISG